MTSTGTAQAMDMNKGLQPNNILSYSCTCIHYANNNNKKYKHITIIMKGFTQQLFLLILGQCFYVN